jgi:hypothetical protein
LYYSRIRLRGDIEELRVENGYADFRESLKLLTYSIHCCVESEGTAAGGFAVLFAAQQAERQDQRLSRRRVPGAVWVGVGSEIESLQDPGRLLGASSTEEI